MAGGSDEGEIAETTIPFFQSSYAENLLNDRRKIELIDGPAAVVNGVHRDDLPIRAPAWMQIAAHVAAAPRGVFVTEDAQRLQIGGYSDHLTA